MPPPPSEPIQKQTAESLLRKLIELNDPKYIAAGYILAVMLERDDGARKVRLFAFANRRRVGGGNDHGRRKTRHQRVGNESRAVAGGERQEPIADVTRALRDRKELGGLHLLHQGQPDLPLEEGDLFLQRPGPDDVAQRVRRGVGDEARLLHSGRENVAAAAAADENLASAVPRPLEQEGLRAAGRGEDRGQDARGARADHSDTAASLPLLCHVVSFRCRRSAGSVKCRSPIYTGHPVRGPHPVGEFALEAIDERAN